MNIAAHEPDLITWLRLGSELDRRSKLFSLLDEEPDAISGEEGVVCRSSYQEGLNVSPRSTPDKREWEWIFEPLLWRLLESRLAAWVCVGHFTGFRDRAQRRWLYYLSEELSADTLSAGKDSIAFAQVLRALSFNAHFSRLAGENLLLTSTLLEEITPKRTSREFPYGIPLALGFVPNAFKDDIGSSSPLEFWIADISGVATSLIPSRTNRIAYLENAASDEDVANQVQNRKILPFLWRSEDDRYAQYSNIEKYVEHLIGDTKAITVPLFVDASEQFQKEWDKYVEIHSAAPVTAPTRLKNYAGWIIDGYQYVNSILTIPGWLPVEGFRSRSGALIVCFRKSISFSTLIAVANAFRAGCSNWAVASGSLTGERTATSAPSHQVKHVVSAMGRWVGATESLFDISRASSEELNLSRGKAGRILLAKGDNALDNDDLGIILFPKLFRQAIAYIVNWFMVETPYDLPFYEDDLQKLPQNLSDLALKCWESAFNSFIFEQIWKKSWSLKTALALKSAMVRLRGLFPQSPVIVDGAEDWTLTWDVEQVGLEPVERSVSLSRLLIHLLRESIKHGAWEIPVRITISR
jgi:hypothetical protein